MKMTRTAIAVMATALTGLSGCAWFNHKAESRDSYAAASGEPRGPMRTTADAAITAKVKTAFAADELVKARKIDVDTYRGVVQLNGTVNSAAERSRAIQLARNIEGVSDVKDNLKLVG